MSLRYGMDASWSGKGSNGSVGGDEPVLKVSKKEKGIKYYVPGLDASVGALVFSRDPFL